MKNISHRRSLLISFLIFILIVPFAIYESVIFGFFFFSLVILCFFLFYVSFRGYIFNDYDIELFDSYIKINDIKIPWSDVESFDRPPCNSCYFILKLNTSNTKVPNEITFPVISRCSPLYDENARFVEKLKICFTPSNFIVKKLEDHVISVWKKGRGCD